MKAQVVHELGDYHNLSFEEVEAPVPGPGEVLIGVEAVGLNFPDILVIAMAEQFVAPADQVFRLPDGVTMEQGACMSITYGTGYHALVDRARLRSGETVLVTGATGGVGSAGIQIAKALGARVIAAVGSDAKGELAVSLGADAVINYTTESLKERAKELTGGRGADVIYDPVGGDVFLECLRCIAWEGRILVAGFTSGRIPKAPMNLPLLKGCSIVGVFWGAFGERDPQANRANFARLLDWAADGTIAPHICARFPLESAVEALDTIANRQATGKVLLIPG